MKQEIIVSVLTFKKATAIVAFGAGNNDVKVLKQKYGSYGIEAQVATRDALKRCFAYMPTDAEWASLLKGEFSGVLTVFERGSGK